MYEIIISVGLFCLLWWVIWHWHPSSREDKFKDMVEKTMRGYDEPNGDGIPELIRQQEQTNKHLQKLINDFFWFRIAIILLLLFGGIGVVVTWS